MRLIMGLGAGVVAIACAQVAPLDAAPPDAVEAARAANRKAYEANQTALQKDHTGKWVVIADGKVAGTGTQVEDVQGLAPKALHRYLFRVGDEGDGEFVANFWYGPRFGGVALMAALEIESLGRVEEATPFPRTAVQVRTPAGATETLDVFIGTVGPPLVLTQEDATRLGVERFEVPGSLTSSWIPFGFRRATVHVSLGKDRPGAWIVAAVPLGTHAQLVGLTRGRDYEWFQGEFGIWSMDPWAAKRRSLEGRWVVVGVDRLLGEGETAEAALRAAEGKAPEAYHRYVSRLRVPGELVLDEASFTGVEQLRMEGAVVQVLRCPARPEPIYLAPAGPEAVAFLRLELAEAVQCVFLLRDGKRVPARMGAIWTGGKRAGPDATLAWIVVPIAEGEHVWHCEPTPELPSLPKSAPPGK